MYFRTFPDKLEFPYRKMLCNEIETFLTVYVSKLLE